MNVKYIFFAGLTVAAAFLLFKKKPAQGEEIIDVDVIGLSWDSNIAYLQVRNPTSNTLTYAFNLVIGSGQGSGGLPAAQFGWTNVVLVPGEVIFLVGQVVLPSTPGIYAVEVDCFGSAVYIKTIVLPSLEVG